MNETPVTVEGLLQHHAKRHGLPRLEVNEPFKSWAARVGTGSDDVRAALLSAAEYAHVLDLAQMDACLAAAGAALGGRQ
jgi:hypothetical protein